MTLRQDIKVVGDKVRKAIEDSLEGTGYSMEGSNIRFTETELNMSLKLFKGKSGETKGESEWNRYHTLFDLPKDGINKIFKMGTKTFKITGLRPNATKNVVEITDTKTGKVFVSPAHTVKLQLKLAAA